MIRSNDALQGYAVTTGQSLTPPSPLKGIVQSTPKGTPKGTD